MGDETFTMSAVAPFRLEFTAWALRRRQNNILDQWADGRYIRLFVHHDRAVQVTITQRADACAELDVTLHSDQDITGQLRLDMRSVIDKMFGLTTDLREFYALAADDDVLKSLVAQFAGVKPPRFPTVFEALVNSVACQQVSLDSGIAALNRLSRTFGMRLVNDGVTLHAFPRPVDLIEVPAENIKELGFSRQKAQAVKELSRHLLEDQTDLASLTRMTNEQVVGYLCSIRGIGRWSAEYVLLRGLGRLDIFPGDDVGAQNNLQRLFRRDARPGYDEIHELVSRWSPYQGVVYFHLLLEKLAMKGFA